MDFNNFKTYSDSPEDAFEAFCTLLFEKHLKRKYCGGLQKFRVVNGAGGDGGIEAYGELTTGDIIAVQAKWFRTSMQDSQVSQIEKSVNTALKLRKNISEYIICVPRDLASIKMGKGQIPIANTEESRIDQLTKKIEAKYSGTKFTWWFEQDIRNEVLESDNEGVHKFWFENDIITHTQLVQQFDLEKAAWINKRYIPELHGPGVIQEHIDQILFTKTYRDRLIEEIGFYSKKLQTATELLNRFLKTINPGEPLYPALLEIHDNILENMANLLPIINCIQSGVNNLPKVNFKKMEVSSDIFISLDAHKATSNQIGLPKRLMIALDQIAEINLPEILNSIQEEISHAGRLFLGNPGTGKTHAIANTVDIRLNEQCLPALIIKAKGAPSSDWTLLLQRAIDINTWSKNEILTALETLALRADYNLSKKLTPGEELSTEPTSVIICIDGLEEDTQNWPEWYARIRESIELMKRFPRVRFAFTARPYFMNELEIENNEIFNVITIPQEGDIPVQDVIDQYFTHFGISVESKSLIRGIDSLYALRLFCNLYRGHTLKVGDNIITAEHDLLNAKIKEMEDENRMVNNPGAARNPIRDAIFTISEVFYSQAEINHSDLFNNLKSGTLNYLDHAGVERAIEFLVNNGFVTKSEVIVGSGILKDTKVIYTLTYQSIMEFIMAEKYTNSIINNGIQSLPAHILNLPENRRASDEQLINGRIIQLITNTLFHSYGKLIGTDDLPLDGIPEPIINKLQINALIEAPEYIAIKFKDRIDQMFLNDYKSRHFAFNTLIYPSAAVNTNFFGAEYLHNILMSQPNPVERDRIWLGLDRFDIHNLGEGERESYFRYDLRRIIDPNNGGELFLANHSLHNEYPLVFAWALSTLDQSLRERLRNSLTFWAIQQPFEYKLLLDKLFCCNDPQIQEDLAAITLGLASKLKDKEALFQLAEWSLQNIFDHVEHNYNIIVRTGFRTIIEKAFYAGVIPEEHVLKARPYPADEFRFINVDFNTLHVGGEEIYPIVHDLAWYVIKRSFNDFLGYENVNHETFPSNEKEAFLKTYLDNIGVNNLSVYAWAISSAIAYMKSLGFTRTEGNSMTQASHGGKSNIFTQEEKYTWLAVHYIQGYLSMYLPLQDTGLFVSDLMAIISIDNPAESFDEIDHDEMSDIEDNWLVKELLAPEMQDVGTPDEQIEVAVEGEPMIDFNNWLKFSDKDLRSDGTDKNWLALFNYTSLRDSKAFINSSIDIRGVLIEKDQVEVLKDLVLNHHKRSNFVESIDMMVASPKTDVYSNPSDVVWMKWIGEQENFEEFYHPSYEEASRFHYSVTSVTRNTVASGEEEIFIPSKIIRDMLGITEMSNQLFLDDNNNVMAVNHILRSSNYDKQEITLVPLEIFLRKLADSGLTIIWFADLFRSKNALNNNIKSDKHPMKTRKYIIWFEDGELHWIKFWDAKFSNHRDNTSEDEESEDYI